MGESIERVLAAARDGGLGGASRALRHGLAWRSARLRNSLLGRLRAMVRRDSPSAMPTVVDMASEQSVAAADETLRSIGGDWPELAKEVWGPEPTIAVIVPTFADTAFLRHALASVQAQTYTHWRCYVVDDASPEDVDGVFGDFAGDERFQLLRHAVNGGLAAARNTGLRVCREDAIQFLDADDMLTPWSLEQRVSDLRKVWNDPLVAGVHGQILQCTEETTLADISSWHTDARPPRRDWLSAEGESPFTVHAPLTKRSAVLAVGGFDESVLNGAEDWDLWRRILRHGYIFTPTRSVVGAYRQRSASMIRNHAGIHLARADELLDASCQWAEVDDSVAVSNARMPVQEGRAALNRLIRAARWAGIRAAQNGRLDGTIDDDILAFLRPEATVATRRDECFRAARGGIIRGLGLSTHVVGQLGSDSRRVIDAVASAIAERLAEHCAGAQGPAGTLCLDRRRSFDVGLLAETISDVPVLAAARDAMLDRGLRVAVIDAAVVLGDAGTRAAWTDLGVELVPYNDVAFGLTALSELVARSPAHPATIELMALVEDRGGRAAFLDEPEDRLLDVADRPTMDRAFIPRALDEIGRPNGVPPVHVPGRDRSARDFATLLAAEETPLDPEGYEWLSRMKDSRRGEVAVIIGNGPSLNETDLSLLRGIDTFGVNSIFLGDDRLPELLTYYIVEDTAVFKDNVNDIKAYQARHKLLPTLYRPAFSDNEITPNTHFFRMNMGFYGRATRDGRPTNTLCYPRFSTDAAQRIYSGQSVTIINLQLAHWIGYRRVVLIGMDFSYSIPDDAERDGNLILSHSDDPNHFHPDYFGAGKTWKDPRLDRVLVNYRLADEIYRATGRQIVNSTVGGKLELFPRVPLAEAVSGSA